MPELPEVELVARNLHALIVGRRIVSAQLLRQRLAPDSTPSQFSRKLRGRTIESVVRRGKHILAHLDRDLVWITHLRMSGRFRLLPLDVELPKFTHAVFHLDNDKRLVFSDQRHFGFMKLVRASNLNEAKELKKLAPEPLSDEFTPEYLAKALSKSRRSLKETILDQTRVNGLGNIYAAEALFIARINPAIPSADLSKRRMPRLHRAIVDILSESIAYGSTLNVDPENIDGSYYGGEYEWHWRVYDREGEPCVVCGSCIRRIMQGGRSTFFCSKCQRR